MIHIETEQKGAFGSICHSFNVSRLDCRDEFVPSVEFVAPQFDALLSKRCDRVESGLNTDQALKRQVDVHVIGSSMIRILAH